MSSPSTFSPPRLSPETSTQPPNAHASAHSFFTLSFSRKNTQDISMTQMGEV